MVNCAHAQSQGGAPPHSKRDVFFQVFVDVLYKYASLQYALRFCVVIPYTHDSLQYASLLTMHSKSKAHLSDQVWHEVHSTPQYTLPRPRFFCSSQ